jgi:hypothetical protein
MYLDKNNPSGVDLRPYVIFHPYVKSFDIRNRRLALRRASLEADFIKDRANSTPIEFTQLIQADVLLYMRSVLLLKEMLWYPDTYVFIDSYAPQFESFVRLKSRKYFDRFKIAMGFDGKDELAAAIRQLESDPKNLIRNTYGYLRPSAIIKLDQVATTP